jgi:hypothetical protein
MDKEQIIKEWTYQSLNNKTNDILSLKLAIFYSSINCVELINLNLLDQAFNYYYWFICKKTDNIYYINLNINDKQHQTQKDVTNILSELHRYNYKQLNFDIITTSISPIDKTKYLLIEHINDIYYLVKNLTIDEKKVVKLNKPSRNIRYKRRLILLNSVNKQTKQTEQTKNKTKKRLYSETTTCSKKNNKRRKTEPELLIDWSQMVSASSVRNYMLNDPLLDFLKEYNINSLNDVPIRSTKSKYRTSNFSFNSNDTFTKYIMDAGIEFENELIELIKKSHKIVKVADFTDSRKIEKFQETINLMKKGVPIIYQGVLHDYESKTFGIPDLIVRSDYINKLMGYNIVSDEESKMGSPNLNVNYHYKIIDIKHSNIPLRSDGIHILNSESIPVYKGQLYIYTTALNKVLGININKAYIWGKKYKYECCKIKYEETNFLNKLGTIDYNNVDSDYIQQTKNAVDWIITLRNEGCNWTLLPIPCRSELYPNMKNEKDNNYHKLKQELNNYICEITNVWHCGIKKRQCAHINSVYSWDDVNCTSKNMGFNPGKIASTVDAILNINRQNTDLIRPSIIKYDRLNWHHQQTNVLECYLDFETLNSNFGSIIKDGLISYNMNQYIFMIGIGYVKNNEWVFKTFLMKKKTIESEKTMFNEFMKYISDILIQENKTKAKMYHWSHAEVSAYNNFKSRHSDIIINDSHISFYDLNKVFIQEPVTVKDAFDFSLKSIAKALKNHNLINSVWDTSSTCSNGLNAMILANNLYDKNIIDPNYKINNDCIMKEIIYYNEIDCKVMWEIHKLIRKNN